MEDYNKIIESLAIHFIGISPRALKKSVKVADYHDLNNTLCLVKKGSFTFGETNEKVSPNNLLFIPAGRITNISFGDSKDAIKHSEFSNNLSEYFDGNSSNSEMCLINFTFDAKIFDAINYFTSLDIPPFVVSEHENISMFLEKILDEMKGERPGKERLIKNYTDHIVVELIRYILENKLFVEQLATNTAYFKDPRLIDIFKYIKSNLKGDLSNKVLADIASVSEDYVGQYFKMLTGINPQDYIEYQRMESAVFLLRTTKKSIREIGKEVGYKDTAYFCRRFKMMFGIPAGKLRRREKMM